ncbi:MAG: orotate phosphoribosyltransferase [Bacillota bacterium]|jgi:orotate phosphoribosyltransferase
MEMNHLSRQIVGWLFQTGAVRVSPPDNPYWYTSGLIGPYYVNTHFLYGSEGQANQLLQLIDDTKDRPLVCAQAVRSALWSNYHADPIFRQVTDALVQYIRDHCNWQQVDAISGGERRDWFFSLLPAEILGQPHLMIFKDRQVVLCGEQARQISQLVGKRILHISDLITEASSYLRAWIPALVDRGATMVETVTVIDRQQGGREVLTQQGVPMHSLVKISRGLFHEAKSQGHITADQLRLIFSYLDDPYVSMRTFLLQRPAFLQSALAEGGKSKERAQRLLEQDLYRLKEA